METTEETERALVTTIRAEEMGGGVVQGGKAGLIRYTLKCLQGRYERSNVRGLYLRKLEKKERLRVPKPRM